MLERRPFSGYTKLILCFTDCSSQKEDTVVRKNKKECESHLKSMNLIKNLAKFVLANGKLKKNLTVSRTDDSCNKEWEVQDVEDEDIMY